MKSNFLVLQHANWEEPGRFLRDLAAQLDVYLHVVHVYKDFPPDTAEYDALLLLGGPTNVNEEDLYPFLREEKKYIKLWLDLDKPCLGFCLGHQLLADAFRAQVGPNFMASIGFIDGHLTHDGREHPLFQGISTPLPLFKWHGQAIQSPLPHNFIPLATSSQCVVESFTIKGRPHIVGLQADNHAAHPDDVRIWIENDRKWLKRVQPDKLSEASLLREAEQNLQVNRAIFTKLFKNFLSMVQR